MEEHKDSAPVPGDLIPPNPALDQQVADPATGKEQDTNERSEEENNINKNTTECAGFANLAFQADVNTLFILYTLHCSMHVVCVCKLCWGRW